MIEDLNKWLEDQIDIATEERIHVERNGMLYYLICTKIMAYETTKQKLWEIQTLAENEQKSKIP